MKMTKQQSKYLKKYKSTILNQLLNLSQNTSLTELDKNIVLDLIRAFTVDSRTPYESRLKTYTQRQYILETIQKKYPSTITQNTYTQPTNNNFTFGAFTMFDRDNEPF